MIIGLQKEQEGLLREVLQRHAPDLLALLDSPDPLKLNENQRDQLRQLVTDEFCATGLGENDEPNKRGLSLEYLIDHLGHL